MKDTISFVFVLLITIIGGVTWGIYDYQTKKGVTLSETISVMDKFVYSYFPYKKYVPRFIAKPNKIPSEIQKKIITQTNTSGTAPLKPQENGITPLVTAPITPTTMSITPTTVSITPITEPITPTTEPITPTTEPITPTEIELPEPPRIVRHLVKPEAQGLVDEGNRFYDEGVKHLRNTFKKDNTFDKENNIAIEKFREALKKYLKAEEKDSESQWLMDRIRDTNQNLVTCRKQSRRK